MLEVFVVSLKYVYTDMDIRSDEAPLDRTCAILYHFVGRLQRLVLFEHQSYYRFYVGFQFLNG